MLVRSPFLARSAITTLLAFTLGCATTGVNKGDVNVVSLEEEWQLGLQIEKELAGKLKLVRDPAIVGWVDRVGQRIVAGTELARLPWKFHVVADPAINAFNIPGGQVYVNTGLLVAAPDAAAFAGVLAHEIGHGVSRHATEELTREYGLSILASLVLGQNPSALEQIVAQIAGGGAVARFSREMEREADELGVKYAYTAGYDPTGMARMFEVLLDRQQRQPGAVERFFASHPLTQDRIRDVRAAAAKLPPKSGLVKDDPALRRIQTQLR